MNKKRLLILGVIIVLSLGSLGVVRHLTTESGIEKSGGYVQNPAELSEDEQSSTKPSVDRQGQTESSKDEQNPTNLSDEQDPTEPSETEEESTHVPQYADDTEDIGTYFDLDIYDMQELSRNVIERAPESDRSIADILLDKEEDDPEQYYGTISECVAYITWQAFNYAEAYGYPEDLEECETGTGHFEELINELLEENVIEQGKYENLLCYLKENDFERNKSAIREKVIQMIQDKSI